MTSDGGGMGDNPPNDNPEMITRPLAVGKDHSVAVCRWCKGQLLCPTCGHPLLAATFDNDAFGFLCPHCMEHHAEPFTQ